mmetsp:Transcript_22871/g.49742  ORF Transcript_22871/g.49742 Transcript_22871/m.49742 type:complete len:258 (-) Transcript_22871:230-1003(-)
MVCVRRSSSPMTVITGGVSTRISMPFSDANNAKDSCPLRSRRHMSILCVCSSNLPSSIFCRSSTSSNKLITILDDTCTVDKTSTWWWSSCSGSRSNVSTPTVTTWNGTRISCIRYRSVFRLFASLISATSLSRRASLSSRWFFSFSALRRATVQRRKNMAAAVRRPTTTSARGTTNAAKRPEFQNPGGLTHLSWSSLQTSPSPQVTVTVGSMHSLASSSYTSLPTQNADPGGIHGLNLCSHRSFTHSHAASNGVKPK